LPFEDEAERDVLLALQARLENELPDVSARDYSSRVDAAREQGTRTLVRASRSVARGATRTLDRGYWLRHSERAV